MRTLLHLAHSRMKQLVVLTQQAILVRRHHVDASHLSAAASLVVCPTYMLQVMTSIKHLHHLVT